MSDEKLHPEVEALIALGPISYGKFDDGDPWPEGPQHFARRIALLAAEKAREEMIGGKGKLWLWQNFVDGRPEYWAFDNPFPTHGGGDPMTLGEPCGYALLKNSIRSSGNNASDEKVIANIAAAIRRGKP